MLGQRAGRVVLRGQCRDNALAESFFAAIKGELLDQRSRPTRAAARSAIFEFIEGWYNLHRLHSSLGYRSPADNDGVRQSGASSVRHLRVASRPSRR
ncbi:integrase core domain-containing protein [Nonomuraea wenchangensis]|uniref:integrase core domain-containing protein n=1 Tax=Nonomuraea wenchangensis TaxID=568860 RepID=UPI003721B8D6